MNYGLADPRFHLVRDAGVPEPDVFIHQPAFARGDESSCPNCRLSKSDPPVSRRACSPRLNSTAPSPTWNATPSTRMFW